MSEQAGIHVSEENLEKLALNHLGEDELAFAEEHILICVACQERLRAVDEFIAALRQVVESEDGRLKLREHQGGAGDRRFVEFLLNFSKLGAS